MRFNYLLILAVLWLANCCSSESMTTVESKSENVPPTIYDLLQNDKIRLADLNTDVQFIMFDRLNLTELIDVVKTDPNLIPIAGEVFRRKHQNYRISIYIPPENVKFSNNYMKTVKLCSDVVGYFGNYTTKLSMDIDEKLPRSTMNFDRLINEYASESITILDLKRVRSDTLDQFKLPFKQLKELSLKINVNQTGNILPFNILFPELQKLSITLQLNLNYSFIDCELPNLVNLTLNLNSIPNHKHVNDQFERFLQKNQQIRFVDLLGLGTVPEEYIAAISKLPNIETFSILNIKLKNQTIQFDSVKNFHYKDYFPLSINKFVFPWLETLSTTYEPRLYNQTIEFLRNHRKLNRAQFIIYPMIKPLRLDEFVADALTEVPNLNELKLITSNDISIDVITNILQNIVVKYEQLNFVFEFQNEKYSLAEIQSLFKQFNEWNVIKNERISIPFLIERKKSAYINSSDEIAPEVKPNVTIPILGDEYSQHNFDVNDEMKLDNVDADVLRFIFDRLNLIELIFVTKTHPNLSSFAGEAFRRNFGKIQIALRNDNCKQYAVDIGRTYISMQSIRIIDCKLAIDVLQYFGQYIHKLTIDNYSIDIPRTKVNFEQLANKYASESIMQLELLDAGDDTMQQFTLPFNKVQELTLEIKGNQTEIVLPLKELFPLVSTLNLAFEVNADAIDKVLTENREKLMKFTFLAVPQLHDLKFLNDRYGDEWNIKQIDETISMEWKNANILE